MADLHRKKRVRGGHRASVTKMVRKAEELLAADPPDAARLAQIKLSLQEKLVVLKGLDAEIVELVEEDAVTEEIEQADAFKEEAYAVMIKIDQRAPQTAPSTTFDSARSATRPDLSGATHSKVRLPKLTIQPFTGELTKWTTFWDSFQTAIDHNTSLSEVEKFNYLRSLLEGPALEAISGLTLNAANYKEAVAVLQKRFGNKQNIIARHMDALLKVDSIASDSNLKGLRRLHDTVESQVRGLRSLGVAPESYGSLLSSVLMSKLPGEIRLIISRVVGEESWELDKLLETLEQELRARERAAVDTPAPQRKAVKIPSSAAALLTGGTDGKPSCCYCHQPHYSNSCEKVRSLEERKVALRKSGRCFVCLRRGHISRQCRSNAKCGNCHGRHHISICHRSVPTISASKGDTGGEQQPHSTTQPASMNPAAPTFRPPASLTLWTCANQAVLLQTAQAVVFNPDNPQRSKRVRIILDLGSQRSYVTEELRRELALHKVGEQDMSIMTFGSSSQTTHVCEVVHVAVKLKGRRTKQLSLFTVPLICEPLMCQPVAFCQAKFQHLSGLTLADSADAQSRLQVDILIGSDHYWSFTTGRIIRGDSGPVGIETDLGWVLSGPVGCPSRSPTQTSLVTHTLRIEGGPSPNTQALDESLKLFWDLESFGITPERTVLDDFQDRIHFTEGRYEVSLPWKNQHPILPDNYSLCLQRLRGLIRRLRQMPELLREYDSVIQTQIQQGIVELVDTSVRKTTGRLHYLPHHAVVRSDKDTTKVRVVYDASARAGGPSLNNCLHTGPKFNQRIFDLLLRFRMHRVALTADIEKAFLMIRIAEEDRDVLRFLWLDDITKEQPQIAELRFTRVVFGVSSSPFLLNATIQHHVEQVQTEPAVARKLRRAFYVDDVVTGAKDEADAYQLYRASKEIMKIGGFNLRKFCSNSSSLQVQIDVNEATEQHIHPHAMKTEETYASSVLGSNQSVRDGERKVLGVLWNLSTDQLVVSLDNIISVAKELEPSKRAIVGLAAKVYDPLGILSPVIIVLKMFLQEMSETRIGWDQLLTGKLLEKWRNICTSLCEANASVVPRCCLVGVEEEAIAYRLCGFCDASPRAFAAVVYLLVETHSGRHVRFLASKTRVAPLKPLTIPRLELLSAFLLAWLIHCISQALENELTLSRPQCFTDSMVALYWLLGTEKSWKPFVHNRVEEIRRLILPEHWSHCSGRCNPADLPSRGLTPLQLSQSRLWMDGPEWLKTGELSRTVELQMPELCYSEMKQAEAVHGLLSAVEPSGIGEVMKCDDFSSFRRLIDITSLVLKFGRHLLQTIRPDASALDDRAKAEILWIIESQKVLVNDSNFSQWKKQFTLFLDHNKIWRCGGRIQNADVSFSAQHPILLHKSHTLTTLLVRQAHERVMHGGLKSTLTELRSRYWIVKGRNVIKRILSSCKVCRRYEGKPYTAPFPPPLPSFRVHESPPFTYTGVDFAGPLFVKPATGDSSKAWICLFTCCVTRAVHLDLIADLTTSAFLRSLKRFTARRGLPVRMLSDNGRTFKAAAKVLKTIMNHPDVQRFLIGLHIRWSFNLPRAPWWGGVFERLIRSVKRCLRKTIGQARLTYDELLTAVVEVEGILNSRPLSYVSSDDLEEPLTPSHLLAGRRLLSLPDGFGRRTEEEVESTPEVLTRRMKHLNYVLNQFWTRWRKEYLLELREAHRYHQGRNNPSQVTVGDIVIVHSANQPRGLWKLGRIEEVLPGRDGKIRGAIIRIASKGNRAALLQRPISLLYPLETDLDAVPLTDPDAVPLSSQVSRPPLRSRRTAALKARDRILAQTLGDN